MSSYTTRLDLIEQNQILNGGLDLFQRGIASTAMASGAITQQFSGTLQYLADRFGGYNKTGNTINMSQTADFPTQAQSGYQSRYALLVTNGTGVTPTTNQVAGIYYRMEGQDYARIHARKVRLQFWVKSSIAGNYALALTNAAETRTYVTTYNIPSASTWTPIALDIQLDSSGTWNFDNTGGLQIIWTLGAGSSIQAGSLNTWSGTAYASSTGSLANWIGTSSATFEITQVALYNQDYTQAGAANVSVPFNRHGKDIGDELRACNRYYEQSNSGGAVASSDMTSSAYMGAQSRVVVIYQVQKRVAATISTTSDATTTSGTSSMAYTVNSVNNFTDGTVGSAAKNFTLITPSANAAAYTRFGWTADAEL